MGAPAIDARIVIGVMIIKHKQKLDDRETIETIRENMYMQYFLGLMEYTYQDVFDRSLFTTLRYRLGADKVAPQPEFCQLYKISLPYDFLSIFIPYNLYSISNVITITA